MYTHFTHDRATFFAVSPIFTEAWQAAFLAAIDAMADAAQPDERIGLNRLLTKTLQQAMEAGRLALQRLYSYVRLRWPGDAARYDAFGIRRYDRASRVQGDLLWLMRASYAEAVAQSAALAEVGYTAADLAALQAAADALEGAKTAQLQSGGKAQAYTQEFYTLHNTVWGYMRQLAGMRKLAFPDNPDKQALYYLYPKGWGKKKKKKDEVVVNGEGVEAAKQEDLKMQD